MTYLDEMRDTVGLAALHLGFDPATLTQEQFDASLAVIEKAVKNGLGPPDHRQLVHRGHGRWRRGPGHGLVRRLSTLHPARPDQDAGLPVGPRQGRRDALDRQHGHPARARPNKQLARDLDRLLLRPDQRRDDRGVRQLRLPGQGRARGHAHRRPRARQQPADLPARGLGRPPPPVPRDDRRGRVRLGRGAHQGAWASSQPCVGRSASGPSPRTSCCAPGLLWLALFFVYPAIQMFLVSLWTGNVQDGFTADLELGDLPRGVAGVLAVDRPLDRLRRPGHDPRLRARVPARLRDRVPRRRVQEPAAVPRHRAVLHELPAADDLLEDHPLRRRHRPRAAQGRSASSRPTSSCWPRRPRSSPASPTTSCRS